LAFKAADPVDGVAEQALDFTVLGDADCDGMDDGWETGHNLRPGSANDATSDSDSDGVVNLDEYRYQLDPHDPDTDGDTFNDGEKSPKD